MTIMFVHHGRIKPLRFSFSLSFIVLCFFAWTGVTVWAGYLSAQHIDYIKAKTDTKIMQVRMLFVAGELKKTKDVLAQVKQNDESIRSLLAMNTKKAIITNAAMGGPTPVQSNTLGILLSGNLGKIDNSYLNKQTLNIQEQSRLLQNSYAEIVKHISAERSVYLATPEGWPAEGVITSNFGFRNHPYYINKNFHNGIDIANSLNTPVTATANGTVIHASWQSGYGNIVVVEHGYGFRTYYAHLNKITVKLGQHVTRGQEVGKMGATGIVTGCHVHYEVLYKGRPQNPFKYMKGYNFNENKQNIYKEFQNV